MSRPEVDQCNVTMEALRQCLVVVNSKWKLRIIVALLAGTRHFRGLERSVPGISTKVLAKELKELEAHGFISRTVYPGPPVLVDYAALPYARSLDPVIEVLKVWGIAHQARLAAAANATGGAGTQVP